MNTHAGRFAPSPTGALHLGSLLAALGSFLQARAQGAPWRLRIDDLDTSRVATGADRDILDMLRWFGFRWDGAVLYQSARTLAYRRAIEWLRASGHAFDCGCTRREAQQGPPGIEGPIYPGTCRGRLPPGRAARTVRVRVDDRPIGLNDGVQGRFGQCLDRDIGDFVILRADDIAAYQLATVVDDAFQEVGEVVRGADLLSSTPRQIYLCDLLDLRAPTYVHLPVLVDADGHKLGKRTGALRLRANKAGVLIWRCLDLLGQRPPESLLGSPAPRILRWALDNWSLSDVPATQTLSAEPRLWSCPRSKTGPAGRV